MSVQPDTNRHEPETPNPTENEDGVVHEPGNVRLRLLRREVRLTVIIARNSAKSTARLIVQATLQLIVTQRDVCWIVAGRSGQVKIV